MRFYIKQSESLSRAVRRLCRRRLAVARTRLGRGPRPRAVHDLRRDIKWLRAALRLVEDDVPRRDYRKIKKALHFTAERFSGQRDARVMRRAFEQLTSPASRKFPGMAASLRQHLRAEKRRFAEARALAAADRKLQKARRRLKRMRIDDAGWAGLKTALQASYQNAQLAWQSARQSCSNPAFHQWRKRVKNLWYQLGLLCPAWSAATRGFMDHLEQLGEGLGEDHDLSLLEQFLAGHRHRHEQRALRRLIAARRRKIREAALKLGGRIFAEASETIGSQWEREWILWRASVRS
jgi:CHAD domain-containing protein